MCTLLIYMFEINGNVVYTGSCTATTNDNVRLEADVLFDTVDVGKQVKVGYTVVTPDGVEREFLSPTFTVTSATTETFLEPFKQYINDVGGVGLYKMVSCNVYDFNTGATMCSLFSSTSCTSLTVSQPCIVPGCEFTLS